MKRLMMVVTAIVFTMATAFAANNHTEITGAGSSFVYPVMVKWARVYNKETGIRVNYQSIGSGGGMRQLHAKTIDFAASDEPLNKKQLAQKGWGQYPIIMGAIIPIVNIQGIQNGKLILTGSVLAEIYLGKIHYWDAAPIKKLNPGLKLPHRWIIPVHRSDGSGTSYNFTYYLSQVSPEWKKRIGYDTEVGWPTGIGGKGNAGVAAQVEQLSDSIGYVEYAYIANDELTYVGMKNRSGAIVMPTIQTFKAGNLQASRQPGHDLMITNPSGRHSWPIMATTFIMIPQRLRPDQSKKVQAFVAWCYKNGGAMAQKLSYVPVSGCNVSGNYC